MDQNTNDRTTRLRIPTSLSFLSLAINFVRECAHGFGYGQEETDMLTLAAEEIVLYVMKLQKPSDSIEMSLTDGYWKVLLEIDCSAPDMDLRAFNLTWQMAADEESLDQMGLLIASRMVDRLSLSSSKDRLHLALIKHRCYPKSSSPVSVNSLPNIIERFDLIASPTAEMFRYALLQLCAAQMTGLPPFLRSPALASDMLAAGDLEATLAVEPKGGLLAVACRNWLSPLCMELFGPYLLSNAPIAESIRTELVDDCLIRAARTQATGLICRYTPSAFTERFFDSLGSIPDMGPDGKFFNRPIYYRLLREDGGMTVYVDPSLKDFLEVQYDQLALPRRLLQVPDMGARIAFHSVLSVEVAHENSRAVLRLLRTGMDLKENLQAHARILGQEGIQSIVLELDLGKTEESAHASMIMASGFRPCLIIPDGGQGDLVLFTITKPVEE